MKSMNSQQNDRNAPRPVRHDFRAVNSNRTNSTNPIEPKPVTTNPIPPVNNDPKPEPPKVNPEPVNNNPNPNPPQNNNPNPNPPQNNDPNTPNEPILLNLEDKQPTKGFILSMDLVTKKEEDSD